MIRRAAAWVTLTVLAATALVSAAPAPAPAAPVCARPPATAAAMNAADVAGVDFTDSFRTAALPDGRWMSVTGDTALTGQVYPASNSVVVWDRAGQRRTAPSGNFFPSWPDGSGFWPGQWVHADGLVYVVGSRQKITGPFEWTTLGAYIAVVTVPTCGTPRFVRYLTTPSSGLGDDVVQWSGGLTRHGGWFYVHGVLDRPDQYHSRDGGYIARAATLAEPWQFWTSTTWSTSAAAAVPTIPTVPGGGGTEAAYTVDRLAGRWVVTTKWGALTTRTGVYTSATPTGPWTWTTMLDTCPFHCYLAGAARVPTVSGRQMIQWSRSNEMPVWAEVDLP